MPAKIARSTPRPSFGLPSDGHRRSVDVRKEVMDQSCAGAIVAIICTFVSSRWRSTSVWPDKIRLTSLIVSVTTS